MRDFVSAVTHFINFSKVAFSPCRSRSRDQTFLLSGHIHCSMIESMWLLFMSFWFPTSFRVLQLWLAKCTKSQTRASSPGCKDLNFTMSCVIVSDTNLSRSVQTLYPLEIRNKGEGLSHVENSVRAIENRTRIYLHNGTLLAFHPMHLGNLEGQTSGCPCVH